MDYSQYPQYNQPYAQQYPGAPGYDGYGHTGQQDQQNQSTPTPTIRNPFAPPPTVRPSFGQNGGNDFDPEYEAQIQQWQSAYAPQDNARRDTPKAGNPNEVALGSRPQPAVPAATTAAVIDKTAVATTGNTDKKQTVIRSGGGKTWEDQSLLEWDPNQFRIQVGNLAGEVTDDSLLKAFAAWGPSKARVIRDKRTTKSRGYGFVAFSEGDKGFDAAKAMNGKYIGSHPVTIQRSKTNLRPQTKKEQYKGRKNNQQRKEKKDERDDKDALRANTGGGIEKKPTKNAAGLRILG